MTPSPLPWKADLSTVYWMSPHVDQHTAESDMDNIVCSVIRRKDAEYIAQACNAFPVLVEALGKMVKEAELMKVYFEDQREVVLHYNDVRPWIESLTIAKEALEKAGIK